MGTLMFVCPATDTEVATGIEIDQDTFDNLGIKQVYCPICREAHQTARIQLSKTVSL
jgi:hypothetical protein